MIKIIANKGKYNMLERIVATSPKSFTVFYKGNMTPSIQDCYIIDDEDATVSELMDFIVSETENKSYPCMIIYTNLCEREVEDLKKFLEDMEKIGRCVYGILMCKE